MNDLTSLILIPLLLVHLTVCANQKQAQRRHVPSTKERVNSNKPSVFITFLRSGEVPPLETGVGSTYLWFRITNNTRWPIWVNMSDVPKDYGDAELYYVIESNEDGRIRVDSRCHVCSSNPLGAGRSITFSLPRDHASADARLRIEYSFEWERGAEGVSGSYSTHSVEFHFSYLPKSVGVVQPHEEM
jgi:hypothetical protein